MQKEKLIFFPCNFLVILERKRKILSMHNVSHCIIVFGFGLVLVDHVGSFSLIPVISYLLYFRGPPFFFFFLQRGNLKKKKKRVEKHKF